MSAVRVFQRLVKSYLGAGASDRLSRYACDGAYGLPDNAKVSVEAPAEEAKENEKPTAGKDSDSKDSTKDEKP